MAFHPRVQAILAIPVPQDSVGIRSLLLKARSELAVLRGEKASIAARYSASSWPQTMGLKLVKDMLFESVAGLVRYVVDLEGSLDLRLRIEQTVEDRTMNQLISEGVDPTIAAAISAKAAADFDTVVASGVGVGPVGEDNNLVMVAAIAVGAFFLVKQVIK